MAFFVKITLNEKIEAMNILSINHKDKCVKRKVEHFYNHINYLFSKNTDKVGYTYFDNHLVLLEKIKFRSENDLLTAHESSKKVRKYFSNHNLFAANDFFSRKGEISNLIKSIRKDLLSQNDYLSANFKEKIDKCIIKLTPNYLLRIIKNLTNHLRSKNNLEVEVDKIEYFTLLLTGELNRLGYTGKEIKNILQKILSKHIANVIEYPNDFYCEFPLPESIEMLRNTDEFKNAVEGYLFKRSFEEQFVGIEILAKKEKEARFLFLVENFKFHENETSFTLNSVNFHGKDTLPVSMVTWDKAFIERFNTFISRKNLCIATVRIKYFSTENAREIAIEQISEAMDLLNNLCRAHEKRGEAYLKTNENYILHDSGYVQFLFRNENTTVSNDWIQTILNHTYPKNFEKIHSLIKRRFRLSDKIFFKISSTNNKEEQATLFWRYIEVLFSQVSYFKDVEKGINFISRVLLLRELELVKRRLEVVIVNAIGSLPRNELKMQDSPRLLEERDAFNAEELEVTHFKNYTNNSFVESLWKRHGNLDKEINLKERYDFYKSLFWRVYEQRNCIFHRNLSCLTTIDELRIHFPSLLWRLRVEVLDELLLNPNSSIEEVCKKLSDTAKVLLEK